MKRWWKIKNFFIFWTTNTWKIVETETQKCDFSSDPSRAYFTPLSNEIAIWSTRIDLEIQKTVVFSVWAIILKKIYFRHIFSTKTERCLFLPFWVIFSSKFQQEFLKKFEFLKFEKPKKHRVCCIISDQKRSAGTDESNGTIILELKPNK